MNYRESLSNTLNKSLQEREDGHQSRIDRLTALSTAERAGTLLWRLKYDHDSTAWQPAIELIADILGEKPMYIELCLYEWLQNQCMQCSGARELVINSKRLPCPRCGGTGVERHTDRARAHRLKVSMQQIRSKNKRLARIHSFLSDQDRQVSVRMSVKLTD